MKKVRSYMLLVGNAGLVVALDQWTKAIIRSNLVVGEVWMPLEWLAPIARIVHWHNTGAAFGLFPGASTIFTIIAFAVTIGIIWFFPSLSEEQLVMRIAVALMLGGAMGNLISRVFVGTVTDFISVGTFPVFNVADSSITIGTGILVAAMWLEERHGEGGDEEQQGPVDLPLEGEQVQD